MSPPHTRWLPVCCVHTTMDPPTPCPSLVASTFPAKKTPLTVVDDVMPGHQTVASSLRRSLIFTYEVNKRSFHRLARLPSVATFRSALHSSVSGEFHRYHVKRYAVFMPAAQATPSAYPTLYGTQVIWETNGTSRWNLISNSKLRSLAMYCLTERVSRETKAIGSIHLSVR